MAVKPEVELDAAGEPGAAVADVLILEDTGVLEDVAVGDYVIVHAGFAISRLDEVYAEETLRLMREVFSHEDMA